ncbi:MAG: MBL fold metallo-hydrolase [Pseudomonadota bacterium]
MTELKVTILGCGSSSGTPRPNGDWGKCDPNNPKNRRTRSSILVEQIGKNGGKTSIVFDTGPDFRAQMLMANVQQIDAIVYTHPHADHIHGIDDVRTFVLSQGQMIPTYGDTATYKRLNEAFRYIFQTPKGSSYPPILTQNLIEADKPFMVSGQGGSVDLLPIYQEHGEIYSLGFRIDNFAYCPDVSALPESSIAKLLGLDTLIIDALQYREHVSHFSLGQALAMIDRLKPKRAYLTHMHTPLDYQTVKDETPDHIEPCFDGMVIHVPRS